MTVLPGTAFASDMVNTPDPFVATLPRNDPISSKQLTAIPGIAALLQPLIVPVIVAGLDDPQAGHAPLAGRWILPIAVVPPFVHCVVVGVPAV
jgi:hypothetical protein